MLVHRSARLELEHFEAGKGTVIGGHARLYGRRVRLGRECWIDEYATVGGQRPPPGRPSLLGPAGPPRPHRTGPFELVRGVLPAR